MDIGHLRRDFADHPPLLRKDLAEDPFTQFEHWFAEAMAADIPEPNGLVLATVDAQGQPSQRTVLLKYFDAQGFVFYTNLDSAKAHDIAANPRVCLLFPWLALQRQVKIQGTAEKVGREQALKYFLSRPSGSQLGAWTSPQSKVIESRDFLLRQWQKMREKFRDGQIPLPDFWGGFRVRAELFEFWQGQPGRLHDRFVYRPAGEAWDISRLAP